MSNWDNGLLASCDEFTVEQDPNSVFVNLIDGEYNIRVTMSFDVWVGLCSDFMKNYNISD